MGAKVAYISPKGGINWESFDEINDFIIDGKFIKLFETGKVKYIISAYNIVSVAMY